MQRKDKCLWQDRKNWDGFVINLFVAFNDAISNSDYRALNYGMINE